LEEAVAAGIGALGADRPVRAETPLALIAGRVG
jgi:hypothetical protein